MDFTDKHGSLHCTNLLPRNLKTQGQFIKTIFTVVILCAISKDLLAAPSAYTLFQPGGAFDSDLATLAHRDDDDNVYFDAYAVRGPENKFMFSKNGVLVVSVKAPEDIQDTFEKEIWRFITTTLGLTLADVEILLFPAEAVRRVIIKKAKITEQECQDRIREVLKPYIPRVGQAPGQTESPPWLTPYDPIAIYAENDTNHKEGPLKYYEVSFPKEDKSSKKSDPIPRKKLVEMKHHYNNDVSWMAKILRDLRPNKAVIFRGRLLPGIPSRPIIDDYRGSKKVKLNRKILQGVADGSGIAKPNSKIRFEMSHPVPGLMVMDYLNRNKTAVVSRRVVSPLFRNGTMEVVEELEYTEVED